MKRTALAVAAAAALLLLAGCTSGTQETVDVASVAPVEETATEEAAPAAPVEVSSLPTDSAAAATADEAGQFLIKLQLAMASDGVSMTTDQVRSAADYACDQIAAGADAESIVALTGDVNPQTNVDFVSLADQGYCPIR